MPHPPYMRRRRTRCNAIINFVPHQEAWVVERMGRFHKVLKPGVNVLIPIVDRIAYVQTLKEQAVEIPEQEAITQDNVILDLDAVLYLRIVDPLKASYGVECPIFAVSQLAQTTMRSEVGKLNMDTVFKERQHLNIAIVEQINQASEPWGLVCMRYEIRTIKMPDEVQRAMRMQVEAERKKRAVIFESEGIRQSAMNVAEGEKTARILRSEAHLQEQLNAASGVAKAIEMEATARRQALNEVSEALSKPGGQDAASLLVAQQYVKALEGMAQKTTTMVVPANVTDASSMVTQAMLLYKQINNSGAAAKH